jgi:hypothetical protein
MPAFLAIAVAERVNSFARWFKKCDNSIADIVTIFPL